MKNKNKYAFYIFNIFSFLSLFAVSVAAQQQLPSEIKSRQRISPSIYTTVSPVVTPLKQYRLDENREQQQYRLQEQKPTTNPVRQNQMSGQLMNNLLSMLNTRLNTAINRLNSRAVILFEIISQVESRITTLESSRNLNLSVSRGYVDDARLELQNAQSLISSIYFNTGINTREELQAEIKNLKVQVGESQQSLKKVLDLLKQAVSSAKELSVKSSPALQNTQ